MDNHVFTQTMTHHLKEMAVHYDWAMMSNMAQKVGAQISDLNLSLFNIFRVQKTYA